MDIIELLKVIFLGIVEGITEWLPISSTGHIILTDEFIKLNVTPEFMEMFEVVIQLGAIMAVVTLFFNKLNPFSSKKNSRQQKETFDLWGKVIVACVPAAVLGLLFDDWLNDTFYNSVCVSIMLILYGIIFIVLENKHAGKSFPIQELPQITYKTALFIGCFQVLSLIPGTSRSGATIIGAMLVGCSRYIAAEFTFYLAIPVMFGASFLKVLKYALKTGIAFSTAEIVTVIVGMAVAYVVSVITIKFLMGYIKKHDFKVFGWYRIALGIIVLAYFYIS